MFSHSGHHLLQIPGPTNVPEKVLRAMARPIIDHRGPEFVLLSREVFEGLQWVFKTSGPVIIFPSSGSGALEAALVNTLSLGEKVLMFETGFFATQWRNMALRLGLEVDFVPCDWRQGVDPGVVEARLAHDSGHGIKAVMILHNETSTGVTNSVAAVREAMNSAQHPALLMVDAVSSLAAMDYRHEEWGVDVSIASSQKGLMLPPGLGMNAISEKALAASETARSIRSYWDWREMLGINPSGFFPYTPATSLLYGLREAIHMLRDEGLENVFARHNRFAEATRLAVNAWGLEVFCCNPDEYSSSVTAVALPDGYDADALRKIILDRFSMSLGTGLGKLKGKVFRLGHLGDFSDLMLLGALSGVEMGLALAKVPFSKGGVQTAINYLAGHSLANQGC
jgi:alanine-glyoxylate transaminase/serine-glyoxylate transaminase/serine-pyruvate transaminase